MDLQTTNTQLCIYFYNFLYLYPNESQDLSLSLYITLILKYKDCFRYHITREYNFVPSICNLKLRYTKNCPKTKMQTDTSEYLQTHEVLTL